MNEFPDSGFGFSGRWLCRSIWVRIRGISLQLKGIFEALSIRTRVVIVRGVETSSRDLPLYPNCVSVPVYPEADVTNSGMRWLMRGGCMNSYHHIYTDCSCRTFSTPRGRVEADMSIGSGRLNEQGNPVTPVAARAGPRAPVPGIVICKSLLKS